MSSYSTHKAIRTWTSTEGTPNTLSTGGIFAETNACGRNPSPVKNVFNTLAFPSSW